MNKKFVCMVFPLIVAFGLSACGSSESSSALTTSYIEKIPEDDPAKASSAETGESRKESGGLPQQSAAEGTSEKEQADAGSTQEMNAGASTEEGAGDQSTEKKEEGAGEENSEEKASTQTPSEQESAAAAGSSENTAQSAAPAGSVSGKYLSVTVPWSSDQYTCTLSSGYGDDSVSFYDASSESAGAGGLLFTIACYKSKEGYAGLSGVQYIGTVSSADAGTLYVVAIFPDDVQFTDATGDQYQDMTEDAQTVIANLQANAGYTFTPGGQ